MFSRSAALRSGVQYARVSPTGIPQRPVCGRNYASKPAEDHGAGLKKGGNNTTYIVAGVFTVGIAAIYTFLMGNPDKAQEVGGQYHPQAQSTEDKFKQRPDVRLEGTVSPAPGAK